MYLNANDNEGKRAPGLVRPARPPYSLYARHKRAHKKSRNGCVSCKRRRVKCDETYPACLNCAVRALDCEYDASKVLRVPNPSTSKSLLLSGMLPLQTKIDDQQSNLRIAQSIGKAPDALLWQYYLTHASKTISATSTDVAHAKMWETAVPAVAFSNPVLSHAVMAFSAFCLSTSTRTKYEAYDLQATAKLHYCQSLYHLRALIPTIDQANADAVLGCTMVLIPYGLAMIRELPRHSQALDWLYHLRAWPTLGSQVYGSSMCGKGADHLVPYPQPGIPHPDEHQSNEGGVALWGPATLLFQTIRNTRRDAIADLRAAIESMNASCSVEDIDTYTTSVDALEYVMDYTLDCRVSNYFRAIFTFPIRISSRFIELVKFSDEFALTIYAHWLVLTMLLEDLWWIREFGALRILWLQVPLRHNVELIRWPLEMREEWLAIRT